MKLIILDRDGVINEDSDQYIKSADEWIPLPGSLEAISLLNQHNYKVAIATNQSGIARGYFSRETLYQMHAKLDRLLKPFNGRIDAIHYCPHGPDDDCLCRKPRPGLYTEIGQRFNQPLTDVVVIGDSFRDLQAALAVNARPVLVKTGKGEKTLITFKKQIIQNNIAVFDDLITAVRHLIAENS